MHWCDPVISWKRSRCLYHHGSPFSGLGDSACPTKGPEIGPRACCSKIRPRESSRPWSSPEYSVQYQRVCNPERNSRPLGAAVRPKLLLIVWVDCVCLHLQGCHLMNWLERAAFQCAFATCRA